MKILSGIPELIDEYLGLSNEEGLGSQYKYWSKRAAMRLSKNGGPIQKPADSQSFVNRCMAAVKANFDHFHTGSVPASNWRWRSSLHLDAGNQSPEKRLEKLTAFVLGSEWANQVPICNGVCGARASACRLDLIHRTTEVSYDFIELKYADSESGGSDHPLFAAFEIFQYGLVYLLYREKELLTSTHSKLHHVLAAEKVRLVVLAPQAWYSYTERSERLKYNFAWLESELSAQLTKYAQQVDSDLQGFEFCFQELKAEFMEHYRGLTSSLRIFGEHCLGPRELTYGSSDPHRAP